MESMIVLSEAVSRQQTLAEPLTASQAILRGLAGMQRRVLADWRALLLLRRATRDLQPHERQWTRMPTSVADVTPVLRAMERRGLLAAVSGAPHVYEVTPPGARGAGVFEEALLLEAQPHAIIALETAFSLHHVTLNPVRHISAYLPAGNAVPDLPLDTCADDWATLPMVRGTRVSRIHSIPVSWKSITPRLLHGVTTIPVAGAPIRITSPERTLLDGLRYPDECGGITAVLTGWSLAQDFIDLQTLIDLTERFDSRLLEQRVGFVLETLNVHHPRLEVWQARGHRGGSSRLVAGEPYAPSISERWNLSINAPLDGLLDRL